MPDYCSEYFFFCKTHTWTTAFCAVNQKRRRSIYHEFCSKDEILHQNKIQEFKKWDMHVKVTKATIFSCIQNYGLEEALFIVPVKLNDYKDNNLNSDSANFSKYLCFVNSWSTIVTIEAYQHRKHLQGGHSPKRNFLLDLHGILQDTSNFYSMTFYQTAVQNTIGN